MGDSELIRDVLAGSPLLLTPEDAAAVLSIGRTTIYALMKAGELRPVHIGRSCRLPRAELERYVRCLEAPWEIVSTPAGSFRPAGASLRRFDAAHHRTSSQ
jgi:excisionase family DNA binding protein